MYLSKTSEKNSKSTKFKTAAIRNFEKHETTYPVSYSRDRSLRTVQLSHYCKDSRHQICSNPSKGILAICATQYINGFTPLVPRENPLGLPSCRNTMGFLPSIHRARH